MPAPAFVLLHREICHLIILLKSPPPECLQIIVPRKPFGPEVMLCTDPARGQRTTCFIAHSPLMDALIFTVYICMCMPLILSLMVFSLHKNILLPVKYVLLRIFTSKPAYFFYTTVKIMWGNLKCLDCFFKPVHSKNSSLPVNFLRLFQPDIFAWFLILQGVR